MIPKIAIIDSGIDIDDVLFNCFVVAWKDFSGNAAKGAHAVGDAMGHGTACAKIVVKNYPQARLLIAKVFGKELTTDSARIERALAWALAQGADIINLSLGADLSGNQEGMTRLIQQAIRRRIAVVAADNPEQPGSFPANLPGVIGVGVDFRNRQNDVWYDPERRIKFWGAKNPRKIAWSKGRKVFMGGSSFWVPVLVGKIAAFESQSGKRQRYEQIMNCLCRSTLPIPAKYKQYQDQDRTLSDRPPMPVKQAVLYPYNKEIKSLIEFCDLLPFKISAVIDVPGRGTLGKPVERNIAGASKPLKIRKDLARALARADTLILGHLRELSRLKRRDLIVEALSLAASLKKNVFAFDELEKKPNWRVVVKRIRKTGRLVETPNALPAMVNMPYGAWQESSSIPVVGVLGTNSRQGKFSVQMTLRRHFMKMGYRVGQLATEPQGPLLGADVTFPIGYENNNPLTLEKYIPYLRQAMHRIEKTGKEIIFFGGQSGFIPYSLDEFSNLFSLPNIALLWGCRPDAVVLVINNYDHLDYIRDTILAVEILGQAKVVALVLSTLDKEHRNFQSRGLVVEKRLAGRELSRRLRHFQEATGVFTTEIISLGGQKKLARQVLGYFR